MCKNSIRDPDTMPTPATGVMFTLLLNPMFGIVKPIMDFLGIDYAMVPDLFRKFQICILDGDSNLDPLFRI